MQLKSKITSAPIFTAGGRIASAKARRVGCLQIQVTGPPCSVGMLLPVLERLCRAYGRTSARVMLAIRHRIFESLVMAIRVDIWDVPRAWAGAPLQQTLALSNNQHTAPDQR